MARTSNLALALAILPFVLPIIVLCALCIVVTSGQNPIFMQARVGKGKRCFTLYKLRTMSTDTKNLPSHVVDHRKITRIGGFLRKFKLDETPQILNVLKNEMWFVGPRPCLASQSEVISARDKYGLSDVYPGITGAAQLEKIDMSTPELQAQVDANYQSQRTFVTDLKILIKTCAGGGSNEVVSKGPAE